MGLVTCNQVTAHKFLWWAFGPPAMILCESGQAWKGAAAADDSCAGMWLEACHPIPPHYHTAAFSLSCGFVSELWVRRETNPGDKNKETTRKHKESRVGRN